MGNLCGTITPPPNPKEVDLTHFELLKVVGKGGFGKVNAIQSLKSGELMALKRIEKAAVLQSNSHLASVWIERRILSLNTSPFLLNLIHAFESDVELFLVMPFMQGGDLRYHLKSRGTMSENTCRFYAAELLLGLEALHKKHIVYRDLKPENVLLDSEGHLRLSDFGLACILSEEDNYLTRGQAGTRGYQAPEVLSDSYYGTHVDVWSYGITIYELLHGHRPWKDWARLTSDFMSSDCMMTSFHDHDGVDDPIRLSSGADGTGKKAEFHISPRLSPQIQSLLRGLLCVDVQNRLGCGKSGWEEVKKHEFFSCIDWEAVGKRLVSAPIKPDLTHANCTADADLADQLLDKKPKPILPELQKHFANWKWKVEIEQPSSSSPSQASDTSVQSDNTANNSSDNSNNSNSNSKDHTNTSTPITITTTAITVPDNTDNNKNNNTATPTPTPTPTNTNTNTCPNTNDSNMKSTGIVIDTINTMVSSTVGLREVNGDTMSSSQLSSPSVLNSPRNSTSMCTTQMSQDKDADHGRPIDLNKVYIETNQS